MGGDDVGAIALGMYKPYLNEERLDLPQSELPHYLAKRMPDVGGVFLQAESETSSINMVYGAAEELNNKLFAKYKNIAAEETRCEEYRLEDAEIVLTGFGTAARIAKSVVDKARAEGIKVGLIRPITLWPFPSEVYARGAE